MGCIQIEDDLTEFPIQAAMLLTSCDYNSIGSVETIAIITRLVNLCIL
jgi:hypothetical protein